jgi:predicted RNase H-like nuclease (RuvC/YqgF family)
MEKKDLDSSEIKGSKLLGNKFKTITSDKYTSNEDREGSESFIPFSQRTSMTHAPTIYEELIQKYEGDIRNHIRIEQQMKLHSDSVINKLEDKEKQYDKIFERFEEQEKKFKEEMEKIKLDSKVIKEENEALKKALEKKIERVLNVERDLKEANYKCNVLDREVKRLQQSLDNEITPRKSVHSGGLIHTKQKFKSNRANPNSGRHTASDSMQMFYSRNVTVPSNCQNEELVIPVSSNRSPQKYVVNVGGGKNVVMKKDGKSPYLQADLEKLKQYI